MLSAMPQQQQRTADSSACAYAYGPPPCYEACLGASPDVTAPQQRARRAATKRRPRPSRRAPTTYIRAGPDEFRRLVHQVTGADDLDLLLHATPQQQAEDQPPRRLPCRPAPVPAAAAALMLPTLDTSASFLLSGGGCSARTPAAAPTEAPPPPPACEVSLDLDDGTSGGGAGFPTLESWDLL